MVCWGAATVPLTRDEGITLTTFCRVVGYGVLGEQEWVWCNTIVVVVGGGATCQQVVLSKRRNAGAEWFGIGSGMQGAQVGTECVARVNMMQPDFATTLHGRNGGTEPLDLGLGGCVVSRSWIIAKYGNGTLMTLPAIDGKEQKMSRVSWGGLCDERVGQGRSAMWRYPCNAAIPHVLHFTRAAAPRAFLTF